MALINKNNRNWAEKGEPEFDWWSSYDLDHAWKVIEKQFSDITESFKKNEELFGKLVFMDYPAPDTKNETQN